MKKLLLLTLSLGISGVIYAQDEGCTTPAINTHHVYENFTTEAEPYHWSDDENSPMFGAGFYPWRDTSMTVETSGSTPQRSVSGTFSFSMVRDHGNGYMTVNVTQFVGAYEPFGFSFGERDNVAARTSNEDPYFLDLTHGKSFRVVIENRSEEEIELRFGIQDVNGVTLDTYREPALEANNPGLAYNHVVKEVINPGETLDWDSEAYGFDFGDMMQTVWLDHPRPQNEDPAYFVQTFDYRRVTGVNFTVVNPNNDEGGGAPEWFHNGLSNIELRIHSIRVGDCNITNILQPTTVKKHTIAPNPASGTSLVSYDAVRSGNVMVNVADMMGNTVASFNGGRSETPINVSNLTKGVYVVTVYGDGAPVSASKLVVE